MILFAKDFAEQGAIVDTSTKNLSFVKMALILNKLNVSSNLFHLSLFDRDLVGIDPHNLTDQSLELKQRISYESKRNPWYFMREVIRVSASGSGGIPYILNRSNLAQAWCFFNSVNSFQVMPRQIGKSVGSMSLCLWYMYLAGFNVKWGMFCKGNKLQNENVDRLKRLRDALPKWMIKTSMADTNNKEGIGYDALKTELVTFVAQNDKTAAGDQARGQSLAVEHWDEICYYDNIKLSYPSATAGMDAAGEQAMLAGLPSAILMTSTAGDIDDPRGKWSYLMACNALRFTEKLYDCRDRQELLDILRTNSKNNYLYLEYSYKQVGRSDEWFERKTAGKDPKVVAKDYLNQWLHGSDSSIFAKELLEKIQSSRRDPVTTTTYDKLLLRWYDDPVKLMSDPTFRDRPYVIGCDTSDNVGRDFTTMCMIDPYDLHPVCTFKCSTTNLMFVARCIIKLLRDFPRSIFIPERNKNGAMFLDYIFAEMRRDQFNPLTRIYNKYYQEYTSDTDVSNLNYADGRVRKNFGFSTTKAATSREFLYSSVLTTALDLIGDRLFDSSIIDEISGLTMKNGRVDHSDVGHDDLLIAFLLACFFILFGQNHQLYGIRPDEFMCNIKKGGEYIDADRKREIKLLQAQLADIRSKLRRWNNPVVEAALKRELQKVQMALGDDELEDDSFKPLDQANVDAEKAARRHIGIGFERALDFI